jgi:protein-disulfide isomerase
MANGSRVVRLVRPINERDHLLGRPDAPATLVEYGDYECPHCGAAHPIVETVRRHLGPRLLFAYRHFPLTQIHPHALRAAEAAEAAGAQGQFWAMHDLLFANQEALDDQDLRRYATTAGLELSRFVSKLAENAWEPRVEEDFTSGVRSGVNGTPTFFINGVRHDGPWDAETLIAAVTRAARIPA